MIGLVLEGDPGGPIGQHISVHTDAGVQRCAHAGAGFAIPGATGSLDVDAGRLPEIALLGVGAAVVAATGEDGFGLGDHLQRCGGVALAGYAGWVAGRPDNHEVVVHHVEALDAEALLNEFFLARLCVNQQDVRIAVSGLLQRLAGADGDHPHLDSRLLLELWQKEVQQARVLGRGGGGHGDELVVGLDARRDQHQGGKHRQHCLHDDRSPLKMDCGAVSAGHHTSLPARKSLAG